MKWLIKKKITKVNCSYTLDGSSTICNFSVIISTLISSSSTFFNFNFDLEKQKKRREENVKIIFYSKILIFYFDYIFIHDTVFSVTLFEFLSSIKKSALDFFEKACSNWDLIPFKSKLFKLLAFSISSLLTFIK